MDNTTIKRMIDINRLINNVLARYYRTDKVDVKYIEKIVLNLDRLIKDLNNYLPEDVVRILNDYRKSKNLEYDETYWSHIVSELFLKGDIRTAKRIDKICQEISHLKQNKAIERRVQRLKKIELDLKLSEFGYIY